VKAAAPSTTGHTRRNAPASNPSSNAAKPGASKADQATAHQGAASRPHAGYSQAHAGSSATTTQAQHGSGPSTGHATTTTQPDAAHSHAHASTDHGTARDTPDHPSYRTGSSTPCRQPHLIRAVRKPRISRCGASAIPGDSMAKHPCPDCGINLSIKHVCKPVTACLTCGHLFRPRLRASQRYCSTACSNRRAVDPASPMLDRRTRHLAKSRARRLQRALTWDGVSDQQILDRDGWRCHICHRKIRTTHTNPHPQSRSIDHIVPLSEGGDDTAANKRAAHLACNMARSNRGGHEQLALIGWLEPTPLASELTTGQPASRRHAPTHWLHQHDHPHACDPRCGGTAMTHLRPGVPRTWDEAMVVLAAHRAGQGRGAGRRRAKPEARDRQ